MFVFSRVDICFCYATVDRLIGRYDTGREFMVGQYGAYGQTIVRSGLL